MREKEESVSEKNKLTKLEKAWVLYDVGNSAFTMLACSLIPIWFKALAIGTGPGQITSDQATAYWALAMSVVTVIVAIMGPIFGAFTDIKDRKKVFFSIALGVGVIGCFFGGIITSWLVFMIVLVITKVAYSSSQVFYDSMLNDVTTEERMDEVSSYGYAWGYIGSCIPFAIALGAYVLGPDMLGKISDSLSRNIGFGVTAIWWFVVTIPLLKEYKQIHYADTKPGAIGAVFKQIGGTVVRIAKKEKKILFFLIAFFLYIDGVGTIIDNCINIGTDLGLNTVGQVVTLLLTQVVAFAFSLLFAKLSRNYSTVQLIKVCIIGYFFVCLYALTLKSLIGFGILAFGVGMFQGSIQSLSRSYYSKIIPPENAGEYFGLYDIFCKGASFLGSFVLAAVKLAGATINIAVASLAIFFVFGYIFMSMADKVKNA
ncbi:MAG: MFS transporter [Clostridiales bacterium]|nr:MFS transporter [Candidatus Blautia equi]